MVYIKGRSKALKIRQNNGYCEVEIEAYDHDNTFIFLKKDWTGFNNTTAFVKYDIEFIAAATKSSDWYMTLPLTILESGEYRLQVYALTSSTYAQNIKVQYPAGTQLGVQGIKAMDEFVRCLDYGTVWLNEGTNTLKVLGQGQTAVGLVVLKKIRRYSGNSNGVGDLKIKTAHFSNNGIKSLDTFELVILNDPKFLDPSASDYHKSGLVFELGDSINIKMGESKKKLNHQFGGYITLPELAENETSIKISGSDRLSDADKKQMLKELIIGGAVTTQTGLAYTTNDIYSAVNYVLDSIELPLQGSNLKEILKNTIPTKYGLTIDSGASGFYNNFSVNNMTKSRTNNATKGYVLELQNSYKANQAQWCVIFDSDKHIAANAPVDIKNIGTFWMEYGTGKQAPEKKVIYETVVTKKKLKSGKISTSSKKVKKTITYYGFDTQKPFLGWVELQYSTTPNGALKTVNVNFTSTTTTNVLGIITPNVDYEFWSTGEFDVVSVLNNTDPQPNYYLRKIAIKTQTAAQDLYDPKQEDGKGAYRMLFKRFGFKSGTASTPQTIKIDGKSQFDTLQTLFKQLNIHAQVDPATERRYDTLILEPLQSVLCDFEIIEDSNVLDYTNLKYAPADSLINAVVKVYKNTNGTYNAVRKVDPYSIGHFGTYQNTEVLQEEPGEYQARYQAVIDLDDSTLPNWSYTAKIWGLPNARIGRLVPVTLKNSILNDIKVIESVECYYDSNGKKVYCELGLDKPDVELTYKEKLRQMRKSLLPNVDYSGGAAYEEAVTIT